MYSDFALSKELFAIVRANFPGLIARMRYWISPPGGLFEIPSVERFTTGG